MKMFRSTLPALVIAVVFTHASPSARAHCDSMDGPVVKAAQQAIAEANPSLALIWVKKGQEAEARSAFEKTMAVRKLASDARELADMYFLETVVRLHRVGEGAPYTGLKPAGRDLGPAIPAADKALRTGDIKPLRAMLSEEIGRGLQWRFQEAARTAKYDKDDVQAGRAYVEAYVHFVHYVEGVHVAVQNHTPRHGSGEHSTATSQPPEVTAVTAK